MAVQKVCRVVVVKTVAYEYFIFDDSLRIVDRGIIGVSKEEANYNLRTILFANMEGVFDTVRLVNFNWNNKTGIEESIGSFDRFKPILSGGSVLVVISEVCSKAGRILGYNVFDPVAGTVLQVKHNDLMEMAQKVSYPFLQNAIISGYSVRSYQGNKLERVIFDTSKASKKRSTPKQETAGTKKHAKPTSINKKKPVSKKEDVKNVQKDTGTSKPLGAGTTRLIEKAKSKGVPTDMLMSKGLSKDVLRFYCTHIRDEKDAERFMPIINNNKLSRPQVETLYEGVILGADVDDICDEKLTVAKMQYEIDADLADLWGDVNRTRKSDDELQKRVAAEMMKDKEIMLSNK